MLFERPSYLIPTMLRYQTASSTASLARLIHEGVRRWPAVLKGVRDT